MFRLQFSTVSILALSLIGCGGGTPTPQPVSGTVTFRGEPLKDGVIQFVPTAEVQAGGSSARIANGKFAIPRELGLLPGTWRVEITTLPTQRGGEGEGEAAQPAHKEVIPPRYNIASELTAEVKPGGKNDFPFTLD